MTGPAPVQGRFEDLFDQPLRLEQSLSELWQSATEFSVLSPRWPMRYQPEGHLLIRGELGIANFDVGQRRVETTEAHFAKLQQLGMHVVSHAIEVYENEAVGGEAEEEFVFLSASKYAATCRPLHKRRAQKLAPREGINIGILKPIGDYLQWAQENRPTTELLLEDIYTPDQYAWHESSGTFFLQDIDPILTMNNRSNRNELSQLAVDSFKPIAPAAPLYF